MAQQQQQHEMSFAQALTEAKQIIVQQSNRIKSDLEKLRTLQESLTTQNSALAASERAVREQADALSKAEEQIRAIAARLAEATQAREQAETIIDRQGQRLTQAQSSIQTLERHVADQQQRINQLMHEIDSTRQQLPTSEDNEALAALSTLLSTKKVTVPSAGGSTSGHTIRPAHPPHPMRIAEAA
jgi:chromosome segregation ATPase